MAFEQNKTNLRSYLVFLVFISFIRVLIDQSKPLSREPLNSFTVLHFFSAFTVGIVFNNPLIAFLIIVAFEVWEIVVCFNLGFCFPSEVSTDTINDIAYGFLGYLIGVITFKSKPMESDFKEQFINGFIIFLITMTVMFLLSEFIFFLILGGSFERIIDLFSIFFSSG